MSTAVEGAVLLRHLGIRVLGFGEVRVQDPGFWGLGRSGFRIQGRGCNKRQADLKNWW
jgi:hypothetical protein